MAMVATFTAAKSCLVLRKFLLGCPSLTWKNRH